MPKTAAGETAFAKIDWRQNDLYRFFASIFASPSQDGFHFLSQPALSVALQDLWEQLKCEGEFPGFKGFTNFEQYESTYIALFDVGVPEPPVPLFESAHDKSRPAQEIALENTYFYGVLGLRSDPSKAVPDYLITQLEFLAALRYTAENTSDKTSAASLSRAEAEFLERHLLNWIPTAKSKLERTGAPGFPVLMTLLLQFLRCRHDGSGF